MKKRTVLLTYMLVLLFSITAAMADTRDAGIIHDGEYNFLKAQHGEKWATDDKEIDKILANIRKKNGGKHPNILYILIDDISFGQMGNRTMNYVTGIKTPEINALAEEGMSLMRMYTEPSCTPTRAAFLSGQHPVRLGIKETKVALVGEGLSDETVTNPAKLNHPHLKIIL